MLLLIVEALRPRNKSYKRRKGKRNPELDERKGVRDTMNTTDEPGA